MTFTNYGKSGLALLIAGSADKPQWLAIGSGSGASVATIGSLVNERLGSRVFWTSRDLSVAQSITIVHDHNSVTMSGTLLTEFGIGAGSTVGGNDLWAREGFPSITFDGSNELQTQITFQIF